MTNHQDDRHQCARDILAGDEAGRHRKENELVDVELRVFRRLRTRPFQRLDDDRNRAQCRARHLPERGHPGLFRAQPTDRLANDQANGGTINKIQVLPQFRLTVFFAHESNFIN